MSATSLVLALLLAVVGVGTMLITTRAKWALGDFIGLCLLSASAIAAMVNGALTSL